MVLHNLNSIRHKYSPPFLQLVMDIISIFISFTLQYYVRFHSGWFSIPIEFQIETFAFGAVFLILYWLLFFWFSGLYKNWYIRSPFDEFFTIIRVTFFGSFIIFFIWLLDSESKEPRLLFLLYFVILSITVIIGRYIARVIQRKLREKGIIKIPSIIAGSYKNALELFEQVSSSKNWGYKVDAIILINNDEDKHIKINMNLPEIYPLEKLDEVIDKFNPYELLISVKSPKHKILLDIVNKAAEKNLIVKIIPDLYEYFTGQVRTLHLYGIPLIEINTQILKPWQEIAKRIFDIVFSILVLVIGLPIWLLVALIIKLESKGPVFYKQIRTGKNGKEFKMIKFRSMVADAEKRTGPQWTKVNDPRVTKFGRILRSSHLDEIPQFLNVLKGDMSIVGPRPERPIFVEKFSKLVPAYKRRLVVRPGITGWWQVKYTTYVESIEEIENRLKDDFFYIENMSFKLDLEIIIRTIFLVFKGHGQT